MATKIDKKITGYKVLTPEDKESALEEENKIRIQVMHEEIPRPDMLIGATYKVKQPTDDHAMYITINDFLLNEGTAHESRHVYEIFINSKNANHTQWIMALTRVLSACFRKGGEVSFLADELKGIEDPRGGYFKKGGLYMPSLVAEIGYTLEKHMQLVGITEKEELSEHVKEILEEKKAEAANKGVKFRPCPKCLQETAILMDGCWTCTEPSCAYSKCG